MKSNFIRYKHLVALFILLITGMGTLCVSGTKDDYINSYLTIESIHITGKNIQSVKVFDLNGRLVHSQDCDRVDQVEVDFQNCAEGVYTVSVHSEGGTATRKVVY